MINTASNRDAYARVSSYDNPDIAASAGIVRQGILKIMESQSVEGSGLCRGERTCGVGDFSRGAFNFVRERDKAGMFELRHIMHERRDE